MFVNLEIIQNMKAFDFLQNNLKHAVFFIQHLFQAIEHTKSFLT